MKKLFLLSSVLFLFSCTHSLERGIVAKSETTNKAIVYLDKNEVKVGDTVTFEQTDCRHGGADTTTMNELSVLGGYPVQTGYTQSACETIYLGRGEVIEIIDENYSVLKVDGNVELNDSTKIELMSE
jgi:plastocyanin